MGLDMYAKVVDPNKCKVLEDCQYEYQSEEDERIGGTELHYWRKHHDLHGWMENLYRAKGGTEESFNCVPVRLTEEDLDDLEKDVIGKKLPHTEGFFFGNNPQDEETVSDDLLFIAKARQELLNGMAVYYTSWW